MEIVNCVKTRSVADTLSHGQFGQLAQYHVVVVFEHANKNLFRILFKVILILRKVPAPHMPVQVGVIGDHGIVAPLLVGTPLRIEKNQVN